MLNFLNYDLTNNFGFGSDVYHRFGGSFFENLFFYFLAFQKLAKGILGDVFVLTRLPVVEELILAVVASIAALYWAVVWLVSIMSSFVVITITDGCKPLWTELASVGLVTCVDA